MTTPSPLSAVVPERAPEGGPEVTVITTCKGRLAHLQQSLPRLAACHGPPLILVDYDCPEACGPWASRDYPAVQVVRAAPGTPTFSIARARNLGAAQARTRWLAFVDADTLVAPSFAEELKAAQQPGHFYLAAPGQDDLAGFLVCERAAFLQVGGYDEVFEGWGSEDRDMALRLERLGKHRSLFQGTGLTALPHDDLQRSRYHRVTDRFLSLRINGMYLQIKHDLARLTGLIDLPAPDREALYQRIQRQVLANPGAPCDIDALLPARCDFKQPPGWRLKRSVRYRFAPQDVPPP